jgi:hypothetical protein
MKGDVLAMKKAFILCLCGLFVGIMSSPSVLAQTKKKVQKKVAPPKTDVKNAAGARQQVIPKVIKSDRNYDGKIDRIETYDDKGAIQKVEMDTTGDGKMNEWMFYEGGIPNKVERDLNKDGKADTFLTYNKKGQLVKIETDTTGDGKINDWVFYENGKPIKAEKDTNKDGKPDTFITY